METSKLPVYNATRELFLQIHRSTQKVPVDIRRGRVADIKEKVLKLLDSIAYANEAKDKRSRLDYIDGARAILREVTIEIRCVFDLGLLRRKSFAAIMRYEDNVARQLAGWEKKTLSDAE